MLIGQKIFTAINNLSKIDDVCTFSFVLVLVMHKVEHTSLYERILLWLPVPWWSVVIVFGPVLPLLVLIVYCLDWYSQV